MCAKRFAHLRLQRSMPYIYTGVCCAGSGAVVQSPGLEFASGGGTRSTRQSTSSGRRKRIAYEEVCVRVCVRACVRAWVCVCVVYAMCEPLSLSHSLTE